MRRDEGKRGHVDRAGVASEGVMNPLWEFAWVIPLPAPDTTTMNVNVIFVGEHVGYATCVRGVAWGIGARFISPGRNEQRPRGNWT